MRFSSRAGDATIFKKIASQSQAKNRSCSRGFRVSYGVNTMVLTLESVDEIQWCDHSYETSSAVLSHGTIYINVFYKMKFGIRLEV